jgi:hypothetical protein
MMKQPGLFSPKFGATSSHVFTQSPQNVAGEPEFTICDIGNGALRYHNFCIDGDTSPEYYGYHLVILLKVQELSGTRDCPVVKALRYK